MKQTLFGFLSLAGLSLSLSACHSTVVVAPGAGAYCHKDPVTVCHDYRDWRGVWHRECGTEWVTHCNDTLQAFGLAIGPVGTAETYGISFDSANRLIDAMVQANAGDMTALNAIGLTNEDFDNLADLQMPSDQTIEIVSKNLDLSSETVRAMFAKIISDTRAADSANKPVNESSKRSS